MSGSLDLLPDMVLDDVWELVQINRIALRALAEIGRGKHQAHADIHAMDALKRIQEVIEQENRNVEPNITQHREAQRHG